MPKLNLSVWGSLRFGADGQLFAAAHEKQSPEEGGNSDEDDFDGGTVDEDNGDEGTVDDEDPHIFMKLTQVQQVSVIPQHNTFPQNISVTSKHRVELHCATAGALISKKSKDNMSSSLLN